MLSFLLSLLYSGILVSACKFIHPASARIVYNDLATPQPQSRGFPNSRLVEPCYAFSNWALVWALRCTAFVGYFRDLCWTGRKKAAENPAPRRPKQTPCLGRSCFEKIWEYTSRIKKTKEDCERAKGQITTDAYIEIKGARLFSVPSNSCYNSK